MVPAEIAVCAAGFWVAGLIALGVIGTLLSKATLWQIQRSGPIEPIAVGEQTLRRLYRCILNVAGVYYYFSLPVVFFGVLGVSAGIISGFLMMVFLPIKLLILLAIGALATSIAIVRSLFLRVHSSDAGRLRQALLEQMPVRVEKK